MIHSSPLTRFASLGECLLKPIYADYSFANLPNTIEYLLTGQRRGPLLPADCFGGDYPSPRKIVLFFIDSFGWSFWRHHGARHRTTRRVMNKGVLTPISALFPSTTASSVTTLNFGVPPARHALYEWNIYIPEYGETIQSLPFCPLGARRPDACLEKGYDPRRLVATHETIHQRLGRHGVRSVQFTHQSFADSAFNSIAQVGSDVIRHSTLAEALVQLKDALTAEKGKAWFSLYWGGIDAIGHAHGPNSRHHKAEIASFWLTFDHIFRKVNSPDTLYLFTADHGHTFCEAEETLYINERAPEIADWLKVSPTGATIYPNGSPRDVFLHLKPERREEALALLRERFSGEALVLSTDEALDHGLFGPDPVGDELRRRIGDALLLPYPERFIWWREPGLMENHYAGNHGGLSAEELITVLGVTDAL